MNIFRTDTEFNGLSVITAIKKSLSLIFRKLNLKARKLKSCTFALFLKRYSKRLRLWSTFFYKHRKSVVAM